MKRMLINGYEQGESRVALLDQGRLEEYFVERSSHRQYLGNIYLGRVVNIEKGIQAAFLDIGQPLNGFLHVSDAMFPFGRAAGENGRKKGEGPVRIQDLFQPGRKLLVQVIKEETGSKGPALTTNISLPGRYVVLMPHAEGIGVSRKISEDKERQRLRKLAPTLKVPDGMGGIIRTAGMGRRKADFQRDLSYLHRLWKVIRDRGQGQDKPGVIYQESELVIRVLRDVFGPDVNEIVVDSEDLHRKAQDFIRIVAPRQKEALRLYTGDEPLFHHFGVEEEIDKIFERRVPLRSGGSVIIDQTEAVVCIDVNSGRYRKGASVEETALAINTEAASEIARQIRLRDLGGLVVIDFIDMREAKHRKTVERAFRKAIADDRARNKILRMSEFCLVELTRRKLKHSLRIAHFDSCPACGGSGFVLSDESLALRLFRTLRLGLGLGRVRSAEVAASPRMAHWLLNRRRADLAALEGHHRKPLTVVPDPDLPKGSTRLRFLDAGGAEVDMEKACKSRGSG